MNHPASMTLLSKRRGIFRASGWDLPGQWMATTMQLAPFTTLQILRPRHLLLCCGPANLISRTCLSVTSSTGGMSCGDPAAGTFDPNALLPDLWEPGAEDQVRAAMGMVVLLVAAMWGAL